MNIQIRSIVLYNFEGAVRSLDFRTGSVNIITGKSRTGKSAIIDIVDYCLGRSTFKVFEGVNRDVVAWYGVVLKVGDGEVLLAKPPPGKGARSQSQVYLKQASKIELPALDDLSPNSNDTAVVSLLSRLAGISANQSETNEDRSMESFEANIKHSKHYLFQSQGLVANQNTLLWRQDEDYVSQHIKDTIPYFLGAIKEDRLRVINELRRAKRDRAIARRRLTEAESIVSSKLSRGQALLAEARDVGLLGEGVEVTEDEVLDVLREIAEADIPELPPAAEDQTETLRRRLRDLEAEHREKGRRIDEAEYFIQRAQGYEGEATKQQMRLESIGVFSANGEPAGDAQEDVCPVCESKLDTPVPAASQIRKSLNRMTKNLEYAAQENPQLQEHVERMQGEQEELEDQIQDVRSALDALIERDEALREALDQNALMMRALGRISLYLESVNLTDGNSALEKAVKEAEERVQGLEAQLDPAEVEENKASILNRISAQMTEWAQRLDLEFAGMPYRLDISKLTVVADTEEQPVPMDRMGSGENWLGCHLIALLALQKHYVTRGRPVPSFLILDQPSQVYFPSEDAYKSVEGDVAETEEAGGDLGAVQRMFDFLFDVCEELLPNLQIIVMEHANLSDQRFQEALAEKPWRAGRALIPQEWLDRKE